MLMDLNTMLFSWIILQYIWFYPLKQKPNVRVIFVRFKALVEKNFKAKIFTIYSDQGGEYQALKSFLALHDIFPFYYSSTYT